MCILLKKYYYILYFRQNLIAQTALHTASNWFVLKTFLFQAFVFGRLIALSSSIRGRCAFPTAEYCFCRSAKRFSDFITVRKLAILQEKEGIMHSPLGTQELLTYMFGPPLCPYRLFPMTGK